jgi:hypothetical protein
MWLDHVTGGQNQPIGQQKARPEGRTRPDIYHSLNEIHGGSPLGDRPVHERYRGGIESKWSDIAGGWPECMSLGFNVTLTLWVAQAVVAPETPALMTQTFTPPSAPGLRTKSFLLFTGLL